DLDPLEIFLVDDDELALFVFVSLDDLVPRDFFAILFGDAFVLDGAQIAAAEQLKLDLICRPRSGIETHRNIHQPEADGAFPDSSHGTIWPTKRRPTLGKSPQQRLR